MKRGKKYRATKANYEYNTAQHTKEGEVSGVTGETCARQAGRNGTKGGHNGKTDASRTGKERRRTPGAGTTVNGRRVSSKIMMTREKRKRRLEPANWQRAALG